MPGKGKARPRNAKDQRRRGRLRRERTDVRKAVDGTEELAGQLQTLLRELSRREGGSWQRREQTVIAEVKDRGGLAVKRFEQAFGEAARLQVVNFWWHPRFRKHLDPEPPREGVLCAFGALQDIVLTKKGMNAFVEWLVDPKDAALPKKADLQQALTSILSNKRKPAMDIVDVNEAAQQILDVLLYSFTNPPALKPILKHSDLRAGIRSFFARLSIPEEVIPVLGGASAIISDFLAQLRLENVQVYPMYHSAAMGHLYRGNPFRLALTRSGSSTSSLKPGSASDPTRSSYVLPYGKGRTIQDPRKPKSDVCDPQTGNPITAAIDDRIILRAFNYLSEQPRSWSTVLVETDVGTLVRGPTDLDADEWPFVSGFVSWEETKGRELKIRFLPKAEVEEIGRKFHYVIVNAPGLRTFTGRESVQPQDAFSQVLNDALVRQLTALRDVGCKIHLELSGGAETEDRVMPFSRRMRGLIGSMGLNHEELRQVTDLPDCPPPEQSVNRASEVFLRYERARRLARILELDRIYIHGNDVDVILRKNGSPGDMRSEIAADLFAKGVVVVGVLQRSTADWIKEVEKLDPTLTADGFIRLIELAYDIARLHNSEPGSIIELFEAGRQLFRNFVERGYYISPTPNEYSIAIVPVMWPKVPVEINPTGAGDICSGISLVYSGW